MTDLPETTNELLNTLSVDGIEYVADIGTDKYYGLSCSGAVYDGGEEVRVLGSVVMDEQSGAPVVTDGTSFVAYPDGMKEKHVVLLDGEEAVEAMQTLFERDFGGEAYVPREEVDIGAGAM